MIGNASFHGGSNAQTLVNPAEIVVHEMEGNRMFQIFDVL